VTDISFPSFYKGLTRVKQGSKVGFIDKNGEELWEKEMGKRTK
jgi:hypothetical protein